MPISALLPAYLVQMQMKLSEFLSQSTERLMRAFTAQAVEGAFFLTCLFWVLCLIGNANFLRISPFLRPIDSLIGTGTFMAIFVVLGCLSGFCWWVARNDTPKNPDPAVNNWTINILRCLNFALTGAVSFSILWMIQSSVYAVAHTVWPYIWVPGMLTVMSYLNLARCSRAFHNYRHEKHVERIMAAKGTVKA